MNKLDETDLSILRILQTNSNLTTKELAERVNLSTTPVFERLKRLENEGYIKRYIAILDADKLHCGFIVFCQIKLKQVNKQIAQEFTAAINTMPEVAECYNTSGEFDYLLKINVTDMAAYRTFIMECLGTVSSLASLQSIFVMDETKHMYGLNLGSS
jgi:Lrp/AsnC family transcriptional regulator, leucine-responsive regulatory protein